MHVRKQTSYSLYTYTVRYLKHHSLIEIEALILEHVVELDQNSNDIRSLFIEYTNCCKKRNLKRERTNMTAQILVPFCLRAKKEILNICLDVLISFFS